MKKQFKHCTVCVLITALFLCFTACKERNITLPLPNLSGIPGANSSSTNEGICRACMAASPVQAVRWETKNQVQRQLLTNCVQR